MNESQFFDADQEQQLLALRQEVSQLQRFRQAFNAHQEMMTNLVTMMPRSSGTLLLRAMLRQTIEMGTKLTNAEESSIFWLDAQGVVIESILARGVVIREQKQSVIGQVLQQGLAGWVYRQRQIGLVTDTQEDPRWLELPYQPYSTRSAICIPIIRGKLLLAILTLMHSEPNHFSPELVELMTIWAEQIALVLDLVRLSVEHNPEPASVASETLLHQQKAEDQELLSKFGVYIIAEDSKFMYADPRFAEIFGYNIADLVNLGSIIPLIAKEQQESFQEKIHQAFYYEPHNFLVRVKAKCRDDSFISIEISGRKTKLYGKYLIIGIVRKRTLSLTAN